MTSERRPSVPWWRGSTVTITLLVVFAPAGLYLVWRQPDWTARAKWAWTGAALFTGALVAASILSLLGYEPATRVLARPIENLYIGSVVVMLVTAGTVGLMLAMRTRAPEGGFFRDPDRTAAVFGATGTMFSVLLALVILLSVETYQGTKSHAHAEADSVLQQFELAALFPSRDRYAVQSALICYGRSVAELEWPVMREQAESDTVAGWTRQLDDHIRDVEIRGPKAEAGFSSFLSQNLQRQEERRGRLEGATGTLPPSVWPILLIGGLATIAYLIAYADSGERRLSQVFQVGIVTFVLGASLLLISALDHPYGDNPGQIQPTKMHEALNQMEAELATAIDSSSLAVTLPCDDDGAVHDPTLQPRPFPDGSTMQRIVGDGRLRVGITHSLPLFGELDPVSGKLSGFDVGLAREIAHELGLRDDQIEFVDTLIEDRVPYLQGGTVDMVVLTMTITPERAKLVEFSRPYYIAGQSLLVDHGRRSISGLRDLNGARVCTVTESTAVEELGRRPGVELVQLRSLPECVDRLKAGKIDAVATDDIVLAGFASEDDDLALVGGRFTTEAYGVAMPRGQTDLAEFVDSVITKMLADGRWGKLYYEYLGDIPGLPGVAEAKQTLASIAG